MALFLSYLQKGGRYALLSLLPAAALALAFALWPRDRRPEREVRLRWLISLWYLTAILCGTLFSRWNSRCAPFTAGNLRPFLALRYAFTSGDPEALNLVIFNILVFVPLGLLLVWHARTLGRRVYAWILLLPLLIELTQFSTGLGYFEPDDILLNAIGGAVGLGLGKWLAHGRKTREK